MAIEKHMLQTHSLFEKAGEVLEGVAELKKRLSSIQSDKMQLEDDNALLRRNNAELKDENRKLKRALYKACSNWMTDRQVAMACYHLEARARKFDKAIAKCRAKAEDYK